MKKEYGNIVSEYSDTVELQDVHEIFGVNTKEYFESNDEYWQSENEYSGLLQHHVSDQEKRIKEMKHSKLIKKMVLNECAIRRLTEPEEVANLVLFLTSEKANNITGQVYQIDCGQYI